ncbi:hypothetical protein GE21DRAFT_2437 [Neurospora crassa]|uniref:Transmembrane protein n=2 Tax=Neurospora crassa TaxID=5141 RepID=Q7SDQ0_NEUCR|nr:hypothetical protein NCU02856 [Neurospora crassa OR74A]EAA34910.1 hypothetical protein NCU02856 [Neurospora crassa OR74A]KHE81971.1 hypothetical protein GE21DRAFT_2437 [Neurospora crassa]CAE76227.1 hypothetical protein [Neurospora crassa]|eukprot:XP_964146.1 hypothetical protein NCU02856 [Neurospora crassa OR74A]
MGLAAPRKRSHQVVAPQQIPDTLPAPSQPQSQPSETSYALSSVTETATTSRATPFLPTKLLAILKTPTSFSSPVLAETSSSAHSSAVALGIVFGVFFGTIIFSFIVWRLCRRRSTPKTSASSWPSSGKAAASMPVRHSSTMRYPHRPTMARIQNGDRGERAVAPSEEVEKGRTTPKLVKVIQSDAPEQSSKRKSRLVSHGTGRLHHQRDLSVSRHREFPHPGRQAVVDVSSPTTEEWKTHDVHPPERSRHKYDDFDDRPAVRGRYGQDNPYHPPPLIFVAGREAHERSNRRSHERVPQHLQRHGQVAHERRRMRRSQPTSLRLVGQYWRRATKRHIVVIVFKLFGGREEELVTATFTFAESDQSQVHAPIRGGTVFGC